MKIAILSRGFPPESPDGIPRIRQILAREFAARGHDVHVFSAGPRLETAARDGYTVHRLPGNLPTQFFFPNQPYANQMLTWSQAVHEMMRAVARDSGEFDLMDSPLWEIEGFIPALESPDAPVLVRVETTSRHVYEINGFDLDERRNFENELERMFLGRAAGVLFDSRSARDELARLYGDDAVTAPSAVIPHGVPLPEMPASASSTPASSTPASSTAADEVMVLSVNRHEKRKGTHFLFPVIAEALRLKPALQFRLVGRDNSEHDGFAAAHGHDYVTHFREQYPHLREKVAFLGQIPREELEAEYARADIVLNCSLYESFGLTYAEAMAWSKPLVAFRAGAAPELVDSGDNGQLLPPGDIKAMAEALVLLADDPAERRRLGAAARRKAEEAFQPDRMVHETLQFYREALKRS